MDSALNGVRENIQQQIHKGKSGGRSHLSPQFCYSHCKFPIRETGICGAVLFPALPFFVNDRFVVIFTNQFGSVDSLKGLEQWSLEYLCPEEIQPQTSHLNGTFPDQKASLHEVLLTKPFQCGV